MLRLFCSCCLFLVVSIMQAAIYPDPVEGVVTCKGKGLAGVVVTDGFDVVLTDAQGRYELPRNRDARFVYLSTPAAYLPQEGGGHIAFFFPLKKGRLKYDFELKRNLKDDMKHVFMVQTDVQVSCQEHLDSYRSYVGKARAIMEKYAKERDAFVLDCGDIVGNTPNLYLDYIQVSGGLGLPVYRIIGNHDMEIGVRSFEHSYKTYEDYFGPIYYSFNRGMAHYIILDNCFYINRDYRYIGYIDERTLQWMEKDLALVPKDHLVFVMMHIPSSTTKDIKFNALLPDETSNANSLYDLLKDHEAHLITGHTHVNGNVVFNDRLMEHNTAAVCAGFWKSMLCSDGTPQGFGLYEVDGNQVKWHYKAVDYPLEYQFQAYAPGSSKELPEEVLANVWNWDEQWKVEWFENGTCMGEMTRCEGLDPAAVEAFSDREKMGAPWVNAFPTNHLFKAVPKDKKARIEVLVTDRFGSVYKQLVKE